MKFNLLHHNLGIIYETSLHQKRNIEKEIYYYTLASDGNVSQSNKKIGYIYL